MIATIAIRIVNILRINRAGKLNKVGIGGNHG